MVPMDFWSNDMPVASTEWLDGQLGYWKNRFLRVVLWDFLWNLGLFMAFRVVSCLGGISLGLLTLHLQRHRRHKFDACHNSTRIPTTTTAKTKFSQIASLDRSWVWYRIHQFSTAWRTHQTMPTCFFPHKAGTVAAVAVHAWAVWQTSTDESQYLSKHDV